MKIKIIIYSFLVLYFSSCSNDKNLIIKNKKSPWHNKNLYKLYKKGSTPWKWHKKIFSLSKKLGLTAFSTPFDKTSVEFLEKLKVPLYKISSFERALLL